MSLFLSVSSTSSVQLPADVVVYNTATSGTLYFKSTANVTSSSNDGSIAAGGQRTFHTPVFVIGSVSIPVVVVELPPVQRESANVVAPTTWFNHNPLALSTGTDGVPVNGSVYYQQLAIPVSCLLTGIQFVIGTVGGTDSVITALYDADGNVLANSALAGVVVGTANTVQQVAFTVPYSVIGPGLYHVGLQFNGTTARFRTTAAGTFVKAASATGTFGTLAAITPPTASTTGAALVSTY